MELRTILFVDGENLVFRYQDEIRKGRIPTDVVVHEPDCFVWHPRMTQISNFDLIRVYYYTTVAGDEPRLDEIRRKLAAIIFQTGRGRTQITGQIVPLVFKKDKQSRKTRTVDIHLIIDVLRFAHLNAIDLIYLASGDEDYLPLIREVMRQGKQVYIGALSSGLGKSLTYECDDFFDLDKFFFKPPMETTQS